LGSIIKKYEAIDYVRGNFVVKSNDKIGYVDKFSACEWEENSKVLVSRIVKKSQKNSQSLLIRNVKIEDVNSADGVSFSIEWLNTSSKAIKYIYFTVVPYNSVEDIVSCQINGRSSFTGKVTGPVEPENPHMISFWENAWYNNTISCIEITKVGVEYIDGSSYVYVREIPKILDKDFKNTCKHAN
jgi:hypothetical protein